MANLKQRIERLLGCKWLNTVGLALGMVGVVIIFIWGLPQPDLDPQGKLLLAAPPDVATMLLRTHYENMSRFGLILIFLGFVAQLLATLPSRRK